MNALHKVDCLYSIIFFIKCLDILFGFTIYFLDWIGFVALLNNKRGRDFIFLIDIVIQILFYGVF